MPRARAVAWLAGAVGLAVLVVAGGLHVADDVAPSVMTMGTMSDHMGVDRYEDGGWCSFWMMNQSNPLETIERSFPCGFFWDWSITQDGVPYVREALMDHEQGRVFEAPGLERGRMEAFYHVNGEMLTEDALEFQVSEEAGVLMPPPGARGEVTMGWVASGAERGGQERLIFPRTLEETGTVSVGGIDAVRWNSSFEQERVTWHGHDVHLTEHVDMVNDPKTGWVLEMRRHVIVAMTPSQMMDAFGLPAIGLGASQGDPMPVMGLEYETRPEAIPGHVDQAKAFQRMMWPIENGEDLDGVAAGLGGVLVVAGVTAGRTVSLLPRPGQR